MRCTGVHPGYKYPGWFISYFWVFPGVCSFRLKLQGCKPLPASLHNPETPHCSQQTVFHGQGQTPAELSTGLWPKQECKWIYWPQHPVHGWKRNGFLPFPCTAHVQKPSSSAQKDVSLKVTSPNQEKVLSESKGLEEFCEYFLMLFCLESISSELVT